MSKRKTTGITLNPGLKKGKQSVSFSSNTKSSSTKPSSSNVRQTWTGGVEMHATKEDKTTLLDEAEDEKLNAALSSDDEDDKFIITKSGKVKKNPKLMSKKFDEDFDTIDNEATEESIPIDKSAGEETPSNKDFDKKQGKKFLDDQEFTSFNLQEEKADLGKFNDKTGDFEFEKDPNERADTWLADVRWKDVNNLSDEKILAYKKKFKNDHEVYNADGKITYSQQDVIDHVEKIIEMLLPHETVSAALKRLRPSKFTKKNEKKKKQLERNHDSKYSFEATAGKNSEIQESQPTAVVASTETKEELENKKNLTILSDLANNVAGSGYYEVYHNSISQLEEYIDKIKSEISGTDVAKDGLDDMFGDSDDENKLQQSCDEYLRNGNSCRENGSGDGDGNDEIITNWEYKWGDAVENNELFGPFDTTSMNAWKEAGYFQDTEQKTMCRRVGTVTFYDANRTDFSLYD